MNVFYVFLFIFFIFLPPKCAPISWENLINAFRYSGFISNLQHILMHNSKRMLVTPKNDFKTFARRDPPPELQSHRNASNRIRIDSIADYGTSIFNVYLFIYKYH